MSIPQEAGKVATSAIDALKGNPSCLAAIVLTGVFALLVFAALQLNEHRNHERMMAVSQLLQACFPAPGPPHWQGDKP
jgi:hypothetical protein